MISKLKLILLCPVPEDQKPISEYIGLKENPLTNWTTLSTKNYNAKLFSLFTSVFILLSILTFQDREFLGDWVLSNLVISLNTILTLYLVIIWRWNEVKKRLNQARLFYEEASWYDGQIWEKPFIILKNDRLLVSQKLEPVLRRLTNTLVSLVYLDILLLILI
tara:strand:- start:2003 stop:2491 length:489 start_codon:yes stop_codon:yes gene_type:complete